MINLSDCFLFNGELDLLEARLNILEEVVDDFVIIEGDKTFSGQDKPYFFEENKERFKAWEDRIVYFKIKDSFKGNIKKSKIYAQNYLHYLLRAVRLRDYLMLSDIDEIPNPEVIYNYLDQFDDPITFQNIDALYAANITSERIHLGTVLFKKEHILYPTNIQSEWDDERVGLARLVNLKDNFIQIPKAGWRWNYCFGIKQIQNKIKSVHPELYRPEILNPRYLQDCINNRKFFAPNCEIKYSLCDINAVNQPLYILKNLSFFNFLVVVHEINARLVELTYKDSDINEHLPVLYKYATAVNHITEFGTRCGVSTFAFLAAQPKKLVTYDIVYQPEVEEHKKLAAKYKINFQYKLKSTHETEIEETDFLFIDTIHDYEFLKKELKLHARKVRKYIGFHDTVRYKDKGHDGIGKGIGFAIEEFLKQNKDWQIKENFKNNNGLIIVEKVNG